MRLTRSFIQFFNSEKASGLLLIFFTIISLLIANSSISTGYINFWNQNLFTLPLSFWINDILMSVFFLMVGLEIKRELLIGELRSVKKSILPVIAALGGMIVPAAIHFYFNYGTPAQHGFGIPMATDIAFSLAILSLLGSKVPSSLKIFLTALAIIDDLGAIIIIALFYTQELSLTFLFCSILIFLLMIALNKMKVYSLWVYLISGAVLWYCVYHTGIHPTIAGVLIAFAIPFGKDEKNSKSVQLQKSLHMPVAFFILPLFAVANTAIPISATAANGLLSANSIGITAGLVIGKPAGIFLFSFAGVLTGLCMLPNDSKKIHLLATGMLAGIGFTMSIFISLLAFADSVLINESKLAIITGSIISGMLGFALLKFTLPDNSVELKNN